MIFVLCPSQISLSTSSQTFPFPAPLFPRHSAALQPLSRAAEAQAIRLPSPQTQGVSLPGGQAPTQLTLPQAPRWKPWPEASHTATLLHVAPTTPAQEFARTRLFQAPQRLPALPLARWPKPPAPITGVSQPSGPLPPLRLPTAGPWPEAAVALPQQPTHPQGLPHPRATQDPKVHSALVAQFLLFLSVIVS